MDALWDELVEDMLNPLVQQALDAGRVPLPLMSIGKLFPLAMRAPGVSTTELADVYLSSVICPYTRSLQEFQMQGAGAYAVQRKQLDEKLLLGFEKYFRAMIGQEPLS